MRLEESLIQDNSLRLIIHPRPSKPVLSRSRPDGSGTVAETTSGDTSVLVVVPSVLRLSMKANPFGSLVSTGMVPAGSENMLNANALPDVPPATPDMLTSNESVLPYV